MTLIIALLPTLLITGCSSEDEPTKAGPQIGKPAFDFTLPGVEGKDISLSDFQEKAVLLNFWQSSCGPCRVEMPYLNSAFKGYSEEAVVLAVNVGESLSSVKQFTQSSGLVFPVLLDASGSVASKYQIRFFPTTFLIDEQGIIQDIKFGAFQSAIEAARELDTVID